MVGKTGLLRCRTAGEDDEDTCFTMESFVYTQQFPPLVISADNGISNEESDRTYT